MCANRPSPPTRNAAEQRSELEANLLDALASREIPIPRDELQDRPLVSILREKLARP